MLSKSGRPAAKKAAAGHLIQTYGASQRRVCRLLQLHRSMARYQRPPGSDELALEKRLKALAEQYPRYGYLLLHGMLKNEGLVVNRKRTYRIYRQLHLQLRAQRRKKLNRPWIPMTRRFLSIDYIYGIGTSRLIYKVGDRRSRPHLQLTKGGA